MSHVHKHLLIRRIFSLKKFKNRTGRLLSGKFNVFDDIPDLNLRLLIIALQEYGVREFPGKEANPEIIKYFVETGFDITSDEVSQCSAFVNWVAMKAGAERSHSLVAQSWLTVGVKVKDPKPGDIVTFWRESPNSWKGHVAFFINYSGSKKINVYGANQNNTNCIKGYPVYRIKDIRRLRYVNERCS